MSRWKFVFQEGLRQDNENLLQRLTQARSTGERRLLKVYVEVTTRCDGNCLHCYFYPNRDRKEMSLAELFALQEHLKAGGVEALTYAGGDPIVREDHLEILRHGADLGLKQTFCTRGWGKDLRKIEQVAEAGPEHIQFSCDPAASGFSLEEEVERILNVGEVVRHFPCHVSWVVTFLRGSNEHLVSLLDAIEQGGGKEFRIHRVLPWGRMVENLSLIPSNEEFVTAIYEFTEMFFQRFSNGMLYVEETPGTLKQCLPQSALKRTKMIGCPVGQTAVTIAYDGSVFLCPLLRHAELNLGESWRNVFIYWNDFQKSQPFTRSSFAGKICESCGEFDNCLGGCRCQAVVRYGKRWELDPTCNYSSLDKSSH